MKVLWFSNIPPKLNNNSNSIVGGSWIEALELELLANSELDLAIVYSDLVEGIQTFPSDNKRSTYFLVPRFPFSKFQRWVHRFFIMKPSRKSLEYYQEVVHLFQPDLILFFGTESDYPLIIPKLNVPSIIWIQGNFTIYERFYKIGISIYEAFLNENLKNVILGNTIFHTYSHFRYKVQREKEIFSVSENFIGRTDWDRRLAMLFAPHANYYHCDEPLRRPFTESQWKPTNNEKQFVIVSTIRGNLYKGLETVYEACNLLLTPMSNIKVEWRIIGINHGSIYQRAAEKKSKISPSQNNVVFLGNKSADEMVDELRNADLYVHPSHIENSSNAIQEAMAFGIPVIATNVGGTSSIIENGYNGLLVQNGDPFSMAGAILELFKNPKKAIEMAQNARKLGELRNNNQKIITDLLAIFQKVIDSYN